MGLEGLSLHNFSTYNNIYSIWRCVAGQDVDSPLALCDYRSIAATDLWNIDIVYPHFSEEGYELTYNPTHRWFYKKGMSKDDAVLFKLGDNLATAAPCKCFGIIC